MTLSKRDFDVQEQLPYDISNIRYDRSCLTVRSSVTHHVMTYRSVYIYSYDIISV